MTGQTFAYPLGGSLYLNVTNRCSNDCIFCIRRTEEGIGVFDLWLDHEPDLDQLLTAAGDISGYKEIVFCGYGEPLLRADLVLTAARAFKKKGARIRVNTNGQASLILGREVPPELKGLVDVVSISLNAADVKGYVEICRPQAGMKAYELVIEFARQCLLYVPKVILSVVELPGVDVEKCRALARDLGAEFRLRRFAGTIR